VADAVPQKAETVENAVAPQTSRAVCRRLALARIDELMLSRTELDQLTQAVCRYAHAPKVPRLLTILMDKTATPSSVVCVDRLLRDHKTVLLSYDDWNEVVRSVRSEKSNRMMSAQVFLMVCSVQSIRSTAKSLTASWTVLGGSFRPMTTAE
jgi:hypothetical protein